MNELLNCRRRRTCDARLLRCADMAALDWDEALVYRRGTSPV